MIITGGRASPGESQQQPGVRPYAPRYSVAARALALRATRAAATLNGCSAHAMIGQAMLEPASWDSLLNTIRDSGLPDTAECVIAALSAHRDRLQSSGSSAISASQVRTIMRPFYRASAATRMETMILDRVPEISPASFLDLFDGLPHEPAHKPPAGKGPARLVTAWRLDQVHVRGLIAPGRAADKIAKWRKTARKSKDPKRSKDQVPPFWLRRSCIHSQILPTHVASRVDQFFLLNSSGEGRCLSVPEVAALALMNPSGPDESPLVAAASNPSLCTPLQASSAFGDCLHAGIVEILVDMLIQEGVLAPSFSLGSACSGIGVDSIGADRAARAHGGAVSRLFMSECIAHRRRVLAHAFHIPPDALFQDASSEAACNAPSADLWICTPPCVAHSRRNKHRSPESQRSAWRLFQRMFRYVHRNRPRAVIIENVSDEANIETMSGLISLETGYTWRQASTDVLLHCGIPIRRQRTVWVGVRVN